MNQYILVEHQNDLNEEIQKPIQQSQRIKFTCFDVSANHIVFGASSGGVYIYNKNPCAFSKILPTKEGSIDHISISSEESYVALSNQKGLIVLVENCFSGQEVKFQVYSQHEGNKITALKWHGYELYSGDNVGRVSVTAIKNVLSKSLFQVPFAILMHLDSSIVQIDCYFQYLLISTQTKTLLCDTVQEQYKQIGKKLREGPFGACFHNISENSTFATHNVIKQDAGSVEIIEAPVDVKIFCCRPGLRVWQVDFDTSVVCTHQFKSAKALGKEVFKISNKKDCHLITESLHLHGEIESSTNFYRIFIIKCNLLLAFGDKLIYILKVSESKVTLLYKLPFTTNIQDIRIVDDCFYVGFENSVLRQFSVYNFEQFILYSLSMEQYILCGEICLNFEETIYEIYEHSEMLHLLLELKLKLENSKEYCLLNSLKNIFQFLATKTKAIPSKSNGIVVVGNLHSIDCKKIVNGKSSYLEEKLAEVDKFLDEEYCSSIIIKQFKLDHQYKVDYPDYIILLERKTPLAILNLFENIHLNDSTSDFEFEELKSWCSGEFLKLIEKNKQIATENEFLKDYTLKCFRLLNNSQNSNCSKCKYPLPTAKDTIPNYYHLICDIFNEDIDILLDVACDIPYMWKFLLACDTNSINNPVIIQFSDIAVLECYSAKFTYDLWDEAVNLMIKLKSKRCLNCDSPLEFDAASTMSWQSFANTAMRTIGPTNCLKLFKRHAKELDNADLGPEFYQNFIFVAAMESSGNNVGMSTEIFKTAMNDDAQKIEMETSLVKYMNNAFLQRNNHSHVTISPISSLKNVLFNNKL